MKIKAANAGALTNFEVLDFLRSKGASEDPTRRVIAEVKPSEYRVFDYLAESPACNQTRKCVNDFLEKSKKYDLAKAELLNIINIRPSTPAHVNSLIEDCEKRFGDEFEEELAGLITEVLPPGPDLTTDEGTANNEKENAVGNQVESVEEKN